MADQSVRITDMPLGGTPEAVALEMWKLLRLKFSAQAPDINAELRLFLRCRAAAYGSFEP